MRGRQARNPAANDGNPSLLLKGCAHISIVADRTPGTKAGRDVPMQDSRDTHLQSGSITSMRVSCLAWKESTE
jgi:hypothetical protein